MTSRSALLSDHSLRDRGSIVQLDTTQIGPESLGDELRARLDLLEQRVRATVTRRRSNDPDADDPYRGLYISDEHVDRLFDPTPAPDPWPRVDNAPGDKLDALAREFGLDDADIELLLISLAPDLDPRFERLYGYLQDDVTRRRAGIGLALELCGLTPLSASARARVSTGPLVTSALVVVEEQERPFLTRSLLVPDRVVAHLLGDDTPDPGLASLMAQVFPWDPGNASELAGVLRQGASCFVRESADGLGRSVAAAAFAALGMPVLALDLCRLDDAKPEEIATLAGRETAMTGSGLVVGPVECLAERTGGIEAFASLDRPLVLVGKGGWDPSWSSRSPITFETPVPTEERRASLWRAVLNGDCRDDLDPGQAAGHFQLGPQQIVRSAEVARRRAALEDRPIEGPDLHVAARSQNAAGLERLARRVKPDVAWDDLVLPLDALQQLREIGDRTRYGDKVLGDWRMGSTSRGRGTTALFAGPSGTGKTMGAEALAGELGFDLYAVDIATVVDKYIGETEKNLDRIFSEAAGINGVLFFDEADALFGKRSEVRDSHDRYANVEVAYLLQRMEQFEGIAILATNLRANLDDAFTRRLQAVIEFPMPDEVHRRQIWERCLGSIAPRSSDLDLVFCAHSFELSGGNIRNITLAAAFLAARANGRIEMEHLVRATEREYRKLGRLCTEREFGEYHSLVAS